MHEKVNISQLSSVRVRAPCWGGEWREGARNNGEGERLKRCRVKSEQNVANFNFAGQPIIFIIAATATYLGVLTIEAPGGTPRTC